MSTLDDVLSSLAARLAVTVASVPVDRSADRAAGGRAAAAVLRRAGFHGEWLVEHERDGRPTWPAGYTGSISHRDGITVAAVTATGRAIGIDIEISGSLPATDAEPVLHPAELLILRTHPSADEWATTIWSAKESAFKAWSSAVDGLAGVDPCDVHVQLDEAAGSLVVDGSGSVAAAARSVGPLRGLVGTADRFVVTLVVSGSPNC